MVVETNKRKSPQLLSSTSFQQRLHSSLISLSGGARSAFLPYKPSVTVLTNLQRGNTKAKTRTYYNEELSFFQLAAKGDLTATQIQKERDLDMFDREVCGLTPLMWASAYGQSHTVEDLIEAGASVNSQNSCGQKALHFAAKAGYPEVAKSLLAVGADINCADERGNTPLMLAARDNHPLTVNFLLANGADFTLANFEGSTAYKEAIRRYHYEVQQILENHMKQLLIGEISQSGIAL